MSDEVREEAAGDAVAGIPVIGARLAAWPPARRRLVGSVLVALLAVVALLGCIDLVTDLKGHFKAKKSPERFVWSESYAVYACFAAASGVVLARLAGLLLRRREDYYDVE